MTIEELTLRDLQPSQFYISFAKLEAVESWLDPMDLSKFEPIPVKMLDGIPVMTDGHTRAAAALRTGLERVPLVWDEDDLDWEMYRRCVAECKRRGVTSPADLLDRIIPESEYVVVWDGWCDDMQLECIRDRAIAYVSELFKDDSGGHGVDHTMRVYRNAMMIMEKEAPCDKMVVTLGALLHDADDHKLFHTENNANARKFLVENGISEEQISRILAVINAVSFSQNKDKVPEGLEAKIVQDADRIDAIGAIGIARTFAYGGEHGRGLGESVQHFYDKLLLLKDRLNTKTAKEIAEKRHAFLVSFLEELKEEMGE